MMIRLKRCRTCVMFILKTRTINYCKQCNDKIKRHIVRNNYNEITKNLPPEIVDMIVSFI